MPLTYTIKRKESNMTKLDKKTNAGYLEVAEQLLNQMKVFTEEVADVKDIIKRHDEQLEELAITAEITTTQKNIIKDKVSMVVKRDLTNPNRSRRQIAYSKVYRDLRMYGLASPYERTEKQHFKQINEALDYYRLDIEFINNREIEIEEENKKAN